MLLDQEQGRLWTAHGKSLGNELSAMRYFISHRFRPEKWLRAVQALGSISATLLAGLTLAGIAMLPNIVRATGLF